MKPPPPTFSSESESPSTSTLLIGAACGLGGAEGPDSAALAKTGVGALAESVTDALEDAAGEAESAAALGSACWQLAKMPHK